MQFISKATVTAVTFCVLSSAPVYAASFSSLNSNTVKFSANTSEASLIASGAASVSFGNTTLYIGTNQVSSNNQDPIVTSFTNGIRDWVQSYDSSGIDARGIGLLWDEVSESLYGVFTADGGSVGANSFSAATQNGWLSSYGSGGGSPASVLLKLNPITGAAEAGTYIRSQLSSGNTNTVIPTGLDFVDNQVVFFGNAFFTPLDVDQQPFTDLAPGTTSPFPYRVVLSADLSQALSSEAIGWNGVTQFSPLGSDDTVTDPGDDVTDPGDDVTNPPPDDVTDPGDDTTDPDDSVTNPPDDVTDPGDDVTDPGDGTTNPGGDNGEQPDDGIGGGIGDNPGEDMESVPEPGLVAGLGVFLATGSLLRKKQKSPSA